MARLRVWSGTDICRLLASHGFVEVRRKGSHIVMRKQENGTTVTVPVPAHRELRAGTLAAIIRQSGLPRSLFETSR